MAIRIQRKRVKGWKMPPNTVYVGRPSRWGNPFVVGKHGTAKECVEKYIKMLFPYTHHEGSMEKFLVSETNMVDVAASLKGKNLACWCALDQPCHADVLLEIANL